MIRRYNKSDIKDIIKLEESLLHTTLGENILNDRLDDDNFFIYVYEDFGITGYISSYFDGETLEILNFCVDEKYQRKGIGSMLLDEVINMAKEKGGRHVILEVNQTNEKGVSFYYKKGFKVISVRRGYYKGIDGLLMEKILWI